MRLSGGLGRMKGGLMVPMVGDRSGRSGDTKVPIPSLASAKVHIPAEKLGPSVHGRGPYAKLRGSEGHLGARHGNRSPTTMVR